MSATKRVKAAKDNPLRTMKPLILSFAQLQAVMYRHMAGNKWAQDTIGDLWRMGAPSPNNPNKRIILSSQLWAWLKDVTERQGIDSLAAAIGEERGTIEDVIEPFLIQQGFMMRTSRGRQATKTAYQHFGYSPPSASATDELSNGSA